MCGTLAAAVAATAEDGETGDDVIAGLDFGDLGSDGVDDAGSLVAEDGGALEGVEAVDAVEVGVANAAGGGVNADLVTDGVGDVDLAEGEVFVGVIEDCGLHGGRQDSSSPVSRKYH